MPSFSAPPTQHLLRDLAVFSVHRELRPVYRLSLLNISEPTRPD